ncbi:MAG: hypothetical protein ACYCSN_16620 [Acidobacteriaceae bacterium]
MKTQQQYTQTNDEKKTLILIIGGGGAVALAMVIASLGHPALGLGGLAALVITGGVYARFTGLFGE